MAGLPVALPRERNLTVNALQQKEPFPRACRYCNYTIMNSEELCEHLTQEHQLDMGEDEFVAMNWAFLKGYEDDVMCDECYTKVPRSMLQSHSTKHSLGLRNSEEGDAGRGGRAALPEKSPVRAHSINRTRPLRKYLGEYPVDFTPADELLSESIWNAGDSSSERKRSIEDLKKSASQYQTQRKKGQLGMKSLGPWAYEKQMPQHIRDILAKDGKPRVHKRRMSMDLFKSEGKGNFAVGVIPVLGELLARSNETKWAYLCDPAVIHIHKMKNEGAFCGYRNTQMFCSYLVDKKVPGWDLLGGRIPSVFDIQDFVEEAWDNGINVNGRVETGGIKGTRKYIGTPEVEAMMKFLGIDIMTNRLKSDAEMPGYIRVLAEIELYFKKRWLSNADGHKPKVRMTSAPPIYFQHNGHSFTVIGFERLQDGTGQLIAFDPALSDEKTIISYIHKGVPRKMHSGLVEQNLKRYRKTKAYLRKHQIFEILTLRSHEARAGPPPAGIDSPQTASERRPSNGLAESSSAEDSVYDSEEIL